MTFDHDEGSIGTSRSLERIERKAALRLARGWEAKPLPTEKITPEGIGIVARALDALAADLDDMTGQFCNAAIHLTRAEDRVRELEEQLESAQAALARTHEDQDEAMRYMAKLEGDLDVSIQTGKLLVKQREAAERERDEARQLYIEDIVPSRQFLERQGWPIPEGYYR